MKPLMIAAACSLTALTGLPGPSIAQTSSQSAQDDIVFVQIEAHPSLQVAQSRAQIFGQTLPDVAGFTLGGGWYGIAMGPYRRADAQQVLQAFRADGRIPSDAYIAELRAYGSQFFPAGADVLNQGTVSVTDTAAETARAETTPAEDQPQITPPAPDETPAEARRSERTLSAQERKDLQIALQWAGYYTSAIDGAFGPGTRRSMADWQAANGHEPSGILTTAQRAQLLEQYNAPLISVGMAERLDSAAGIRMQMPLGAVQFSQLEPPFAKYDSASDDGIRLLLISQPGDRRTLYGLYDIMQTLEIVPLDGPRQRGDQSFTLEGRNGRMVSYTEAALKDGQIKGFTLIWPAGDEERRSRVLAAMRSSFERVDGVLDPAAGGDAVQSVDLVSGLAVRKPRLSRSGFFVDGSGAVVTTTEAVDACGKITLDNAYDADLVGTVGDLALLRPVQPLAPAEVAQFRQSSARLKSDVSVSGYSFEGKLGAPTLTFGRLEDLQGLRGEAELTRLAMSAEAGDAGGPVLDDSGAVLGMLLPRASGAQQLPDGVSFALNGAAVTEAMGGLGVAASAAEAGTRATPNDLLRTAQGMTVLVSCWD